MGGAGPRAEGEGIDLAPTWLGTNPGSATSGLWTLGEPTHFSPPQFTHL